MKDQKTLPLLLLAAVLMAGGAMAQDDPGTEPGDGPGRGQGVCRFVDEDGDGFNDLAPDHDGDGIPNGLDPDYVPPAENNGSRNRFGFGNMFGWLEGLFGQYAVEDGASRGHMFGVRDGSGASFGPADGAGFGPGAADGGNGRGSAGDNPGGAGGFGGQGSSGAGGNGNGNGGGGR